MILEVELLYCNQKMTKNAKKKTFKILKKKNVTLNNVKVTVKR